MLAPRSGGLRDLVLVGAGHSHVQVLRKWAMAPVPSVRLMVVVDTPIAVYSAMVPGLIAGQYRPEELEIDVLPLARRAGAGVVLARATAVHPAERRIELAGRPALRYDVASLDVGSAPAVEGTPGAVEHAVLTRPIGELVRRVAAREPAAGSNRVVVVGGGAAGVELAFCHRARRGHGRPPEVTLLESSGRVLPGYPEALSRRITALAAHAGVVIRVGARVVQVEGDTIWLESGERVAYDVLVWAGGAAGPAWLANGELPLCDRGFVRTRRTLQVVGHDDLFASGDCATLVDFPSLPKAGVYAVRQGPFLADNIRARLLDEPLTRYRPQSSFLTLMNLGDGTAVGFKWGLFAHGRSVMRAKDRIDRAFVRRFQALDIDGDPSHEDDAIPSAAPRMTCGGCAAKPSQALLYEALGRQHFRANTDVVMGLDQPDDAAAVRLPSGGLLVASVDGFRSFLDDPYVIGSVSAVNAVSDLQAKGVDARHALAFVVLPDVLSEPQQKECLTQVLSGARAMLDSLGVSIVGGHTMTGTELLVGFTALGTTSAEASLLRLSGLQKGQLLVLTKPLGTGVLLHANMFARARGSWLRSAIEGMLTDNGRAAVIVRERGATACTDVTGYGLAGHLAAMLRASRLSARITLHSVPALPGALALLGKGVQSDYHEQNVASVRSLVRNRVRSDDPRYRLLFDPQTAGGLLFGADPAQSERVIEELRGAGYPHASVVGIVGEAHDGELWLEVTD